MLSIAPVLIIGIGNPSRGDDALGPRLIERLEPLHLPGVELLTDFQLQVEIALDLQGRREVIICDASIDAPAPFRFAPVKAAQDASHSSHQLSPGALLHVYQKLFGPAPTTFLLAILGQDFELGAELGVATTSHLEAALNFINERFSDTCTRIPGTIS